MTEALESFTPSKYTVLVVDDDDTLRRALVWDLKRKGYQTFEAENGEVALKFTESHPVDLVLTDIRMPVCDGIQLLEHLKKKNNHLPVVMFLSGFSDLTAEEACNLGAEAVFSKPFQRKALFQGIEGAIQKRQQRWISPSADITSAQPTEPVKGSFTCAVTARNSSEPVIAFGRGGFFLSQSHVPAHWVSHETLLPFDIEIQAGPVAHLKGTGRIIWIRNAPDLEERAPGVGVEILLLEPSQIPGLLEWTTRENPRAWIPRG